MKKQLILLFWLLALIVTAQADTLPYAGTNREQIREATIGSLSWIQFFVYVGFGYIGLLINSVMEITGRDTSESKGKIKKFSSGYWLRDNWKKMIASLLVVPMGILLSKEVFGLELTKINALAIGGFADNIFERYKNKIKFLTTPK